MRKALLLLLALAWSSCSDDPGVGAVAAQVTADPASLDFGGVVIGSRSEETVQIHNGGRAEARLAIRDLPPGFAVEPTSVRVPAAGRADLEITFRPEEAGAVEGAAVFALGGAKASDFSIGLKGLGIARDVAVGGLDFGEVVVGESRTLPLEIESHSDGHLSMELELEGVESAVFELAHDAVELSPRETATVDITFRPDIRGPRSARLVYRPCRSCDAASVELRGAGALRRIDAAPPVVDFGQVTAGSSLEKRLVLYNNGDVPVTLASAAIGGDDAAEFTGDLSALPVLIAPEDSLELAVAFAPPGGASSDPRQAELVFQGEEGGFELAVGLVGTPGGPILSVSPSFIGFGLQPVGWAAQRSLEVRNLGEEGPVLVLSMAIEGADGTTFQAVPEVPLPVDVGFAPLRVDTFFQSAVTAHHSAELVIATNDDEQPELRVPLSGEGASSAPCDLVVHPPQLRFGLVMENRTYERSVELRNGGAAPCLIWDVALEEGSSELFSDAGLPQEPTLLEPGEGVRLPVEFAPFDVPIRTYGAVLRVRHTDASVAPLLIAVSGFPATIDLVATPNPVQMGTWPVGFRNFRSVRLSNRSELDVRVQTARWASYATEAFGGGLVDTPPEPLDMGQTLPLQLSYGPQTPGSRDFAEYEVYINNLAEPFLIDVWGSGNEEPCGELCNAPTAFCPDPVTTRVLDPVRLVGAGRAPPNDAYGCEWTVVDGPQGTRAATDPNRGCDVQFAPDLVGTYEIELTIRDHLTDAAGTCRTQVTAEPVGGLWVEMVWTPARDMDLHLVHPDAGDPLLYETWTDPLFACFYDTCTPARPALSWDQPTEDDDPSLDRDDISGTGPENARIQSPSDAHPYRLGFRNFSNPDVPVSVIFNVYCGGGKVHGQTWQSTEMQEIVYVGDVTYDEDGCTFDTVGAVLPPPPEP